MYEIKPVAWLVGNSWVGPYAIRKTQPKGWGYVQPLIRLVDHQSAIDALRKQVEWMPIETAPKDGSLFLGWVSAVRYVERDDGLFDQADISEVDFCHWREMVTGGFYENMAGNFADGQMITHWRPLPTPPEHHYTITSAGRAHLAGEGK